MPSTKHTQRRKSDQKTARPFSMKKALVISTISVTAFLLVVPAVAIWLPDELAAGGEKAAMVKYLNEKYGKEFVVGKPERKASGFGVEGYLEAEAHPVADDMIKFTVWSWSTGIEDTYPYAVWSNSESLRADTFLKGVYSTPPQYTIKIADVAGSDLSDKINSGSIPTFEQALDLYPESISYTIRVIEAAGAVKDDRLLASRCYQVIEYVRKIPVKSAIVSCSIRQSDGTYYGVTVSNEEYDHISGYSDLIKEIKTWRMVQ